MKEKKTEEAVEETPKVSNELMEYLEFARYCIHQNAIFRDFKSGFARDYRGDHRMATRFKHGTFDFIRSLSPLESLGRF